MVLVGRVYLLVLGLVLRCHVPVEAVLEARGIVLVLYSLELRL